MAVSPHGPGRRPGPSRWCPRLAREPGPAVTEELAVQITDTANFRNPHYHQPSDTPETLDLDRLAAIIAATAVTVEHTAGCATAAP